jgi:hypothetical protein
VCQIKKKKQRKQCISAKNVTVVSA